MTPPGSSTPNETAIRGPTNELLLRPRWHDRVNGPLPAIPRPKLNLNTVFWKRILVQALTPTDAVVSITREGSGRGDQAALASRTLGGSAMRAALNSGPMVPVAGSAGGLAPPPLALMASPRPPTTPRTHP